MKSKKYVINTRLFITQSQQFYVCNKCKKIIIFVIAFIFITGDLASAQELPKRKLTNPSFMYIKSQVIKQMSETNPYPFHHFLTLYGIKGYQLLISRSRGISCPMYPHCSLYSYQAFKEYNPIKAFLMTTDRLYRCGRDLENYDVAEIDGFVRFLDSLYPSFTDRKMFSNTRIFNSSFVFSPKKSYTLLHTSSKDNLNEEKRLLDFAETLNSEGDYNRALTEYRRLIFYYPNSKYKLKAQKSMFHCYYNLSEYFKAIRFGSELIEKNMDLAYTTELRFFIGVSYLKLGNFPFAERNLMEVIATNNVGFRDKSFLLLGLSYATESNWDEADKFFDRISSNSIFFDNAMECKRLSQEGKKLNYKSPTTAGILAVIPGLGYLYDGYRGTALSSFIVNGLFIWGTIESFRNDNHGLGTVLGIFAFGWYTGNIYGSIASAQRKNMKIKNDLLMKFNIGFQF